MKLVMLNISVVLLFMCSSVWAQSQDCSKQNLSNTAEGKCLNSVFQNQKIQLNQLYDKAYAATSAKAEFEAAQKAWLNYRNKQCGAFISEDFTDANATASELPQMIESELPLLIKSCEIALTKQRIEYLHSIDY